MTKDIQKWADTAMFTAEKSDAEAGPVAYLLGGPADPLGQIAACAKMYKGEVVRDLADVTDEERRNYAEQVQKTVLGMPLEAVSLHFMLEGVHRGITHQMVRQRTAAYAQESTRFAVKEDLTTATALPPSLQDTLSLEAYAELENLERIALGLTGFTKNDGSDDWDNFVHQCYEGSKGAQRQRFDWDEAVKVIGQTYMGLIDGGMAAEEARGLMPTNITTRLNYITNYRNFLDTIGVRVSDQAQFEWRKVAMAYALAMRAYGKTQSYWTTIPTSEYDSWDQRFPSNPILQRRKYNSAEKTVQIRLSSEWQYIAMTHAMKPIDFKLGRRAFAADFDRPSRIGERIDAFVARGIPSSEWTIGSPENSIPPIHPDEWLLDPNSARLDATQEFDIFGNRVPKGTGWHWSAGELLRNTNGNQMDGYDQALWPNDFQGVGE